MLTPEYRKLFLEIRKSPFTREHPTADGGTVKEYYTSQAEKMVGRPTLIRTLKKGGGGREFLYDPNGKPILEVKLKHGKPYGRAKMFDENGVQVFPNTYWYYGVELEGAHNELQQEEAREKELIKEKNEALKKNKDPSPEKIYSIEKFYSAQIDKIYASKEVYLLLKIYADLFMPKMSQKKTLLKKYFDKGR